MLHPVLASCNTETKRHHVSINWIEKRPQLMMIILFPIHAMIRVKVSVRGRVRHVLYTTVA